MANAPCVALLLWLGACAAPGPMLVEQRPRPNLIVVLADDMGAETLGCYGGESYATPNLDRLAKEGVVCENAFTQPLCSPTRNELLTGRSNARNYRSFSVLDPAERTFAEHLRAGGYRTMAVGKWQLYGANHYAEEEIRASGTLPEDAGFDQHVLWQVEELGSRYWGPKLRVNGETQTFDSTHYGPDIALSHALEWIDEGGDEPFLLYWPMILPHGPFLAPPGSAGTREPPSDRTLYGPMVEYVDHLMGELVAHVEERELERETWVLFIGDNGSPLGIVSTRNGEEVAGGKRLPNDAGSRVPFLLWAPGQLVAGSRLSDPVSTVDVFSTLADLAGLPLPDDRPLDGWSLVPRLAGERERHRDWVNFHHRPRPISQPDDPTLRWARDERWQLFDDGRLYDTRSDPLLERPLDPEDERGKEARERLLPGLAALPQPLENRDTAQPARRQNVLFVLVDDLGFMDVEPNNPDTFYETPNVSRLAAEGMRFTAGYAASPVCSPTRYSIQAGKYPTRVGATDYFTGRRACRFAPAPLRNEMPLDELTIAQALREEGYATYFAGKWHLGNTPEHWPEERGYDVNIGGHERGGPYGPGRYFTPYGNPRLEDGPEGEHLPERLGRETAAFIREHRDEPFFAFLSFYSVHTPLMAPPELVAKYEEKARRLGLDQLETFGEEEQIWGDKPRRVREVQAHATYAGMVESMDRALGVVLDALDESGVADDTLVVFFSDNGGLSTSEGSPTSNLPLRGGKGWLYEGGVREPLIVRWPGVTAPGSVCDEPVISTDFYPTLLAATQSPARPEQHLDGQSLVPLLRGERLEPRSLYWHYPHYSNQGGHPGAAVRRGRWKLIEGFEEGRLQLFDLEFDPGESYDLAESQPDLVSELQADLHAWYDEVGANFLQAKEEGPMPWRPGTPPEDDRGSRE